eukprot:359423_1
MAQQVEPFGDHNKSRYRVTGTVVQSLDGNHGAVYGTKWINSGSHEWIIRYENTGNRCCGNIGIASHSDQLTSEGWAKAVNVCFRHLKANSESHINLLGKDNSATINPKLASGDTLRIVLNYLARTVVFYDKNDTQILSANELPSGKDIAYRVFVDGDGKDDKYTILKSSGGAVEISLKQLSIELNAINEALQKANEQVKTLQMDQLAQMKEQTSTFLNEYKEFEQNCENVKNAVQSLDQEIEKEMNPNTSNYKEWEIEHICRYVLSLEKQRFAKYMDALKPALEKQQIAGADLPEIEANDLYTMGIDNFKDRKALAKYFKNLDTTEGDVATENH